MAQNQQYEDFIKNLQDDVPETLLSKTTNSNIADYITHETCKIYYKSFKNKWMPLSFLEFYVEEFKNHSPMSQDYLKPFFSLYKPEDARVLVENYYSSNYCLITKRKEKNGETHYFIQPNHLLNLDLASPDVLGFSNESLYKNLDLVNKHILNRDELLNLRELYENFMMRKVVLNTAPKIPTTKKIKQNTETVKEDKTPEHTKPEDQMLIGNKTEIPEQHGKVTKLLFPKLLLPSPYPILQDKSRINSEHRAKKFTQIDKQVKIINQYRFNRIKYRAAFIEKRKTASKPKKKTFEFDF